METKTSQVCIPADVPPASREAYRRNHTAITRGCGRLMLFAGDQKVEHLNEDFSGPGIHIDDGDPEHLFRIAANAKIGVFATQLGLIPRYGSDYQEIPYLVKLNARTNLVKTSQSDPRSLLWHTVEQVVRFRADSGLLVPAVGYTVYLGSCHEAEMLSQAAQIVHEAHLHGLLTVIWMYPRGQAVKEEKDPGLIAGAAGVAVCLGSDFVKVNAPLINGQSSTELLKEAVRAAGRTGVVCAGGGSDRVEDFLVRLYEQIHVGGAAGNATGRNIHQRSLAEAIRMGNAIYSITVDNATAEEAIRIFHTPPIA